MIPIMTTSFKARLKMRSTQLLHDILGTKGNGLRNNIQRWYVEKYNSYDHTYTVVFRTRDEMAMVILATLQ